MTTAFTVPWGAVYAADKEGRAQPSPLFAAATPWKLFSVNVSLTRFWACSTAQFVITHDILSGAEMDIEELVKSTGIAPEDPIAIDLGYAQTPGSDKGVSKRRVFFGYVDTINVKASARGVKVTVNCRDPLRFLIDNKFSGSVFGENLSIGSVVGFDDRRGDLGGGKPLSIDEVTQALKVGDNWQQEGLQKHFVIAWLIYAGSNGGCLPGPLGPKIDRNSGADLSRIPDPLIERSSRPLSAPEDQLRGIQGFNIMNRFPLEVIKHLGSLEAEPRELYADIDTGRICWRKRRTFGLDKPRVLTFLKPAPDGTQPNVISAETDWSTVGTISEIVVINPLSETKGAGALPGSGVLNVSGRLPDDRFFPDFVSVAFPGIKHFTRRTRYIFDDTIKSTDIFGAKALVDAMFRIWGKDVRAGTAIIPGDQNIRPGQAIQCYNFGLFDGQKFRVEAVMHKFTATGANKGFRTSLAFSETDEDREALINKVKEPKGRGGIGDSNYFFNEEINGPLRGKVHVQGSPDSNLGSNLGD